MSGPKVIVIVTREEIIATCNRHLAELDAAISNWRNICEKHGLADLKDVEAVLKRQAELRLLLAKEQFLELQKHVPLAIQFLNADVTARVKKAAEAEATAKTEQARLSSFASSMLSKLTASNIQIPAELAEVLKLASLNSDLKPGLATQAISKAIDLLTAKASPSELTDSQKKLVADLGDGHRNTVLKRWPDQQTVHLDDLTEKVHFQIADLSLFAGEEAVASFTARAGAIASEPSETRRKLLAESLLFEVNAAARAHNERRRVLQDIEAFLLRLDGVDEKSRAVRSRLASAHEIQSVEALIALASEAHSALEARDKAAAAGARRQAVLNGLSQLGYELREGMMTTLAKEGQIVVRKAVNPDYGVEVIAPGEVERFQVRAVAFGASGAARDPQRDRDMETIWCSEFDKLAAIVANNGGHVSITKAIPAGQTQLKIIDSQAAGPHSDVEFARPIERKLKL